MGDHQRLDPAIAAHYADVSEQRRLGPFSLERVRTWELLSRHLLDLAGSEHEWLSATMPQFTEAMRWPEA